MAFIFNDAKFKLTDSRASGGISITLDTFYAVLVTATPTATFTARSSLTEPTGGTYAPVTLAGLSHTITSGVGKWTCTSPVWTALTVSGSPTILGMVICKRAGGSPATSDQPVVYIDFVSGGTPNGSDFTGTLGTNGLYIY